MDIIETVMSNGNIRLSLLEQKMLKDANIVLAENTYLTEKVGPHRITTALAVARNDYICDLRPDVHAASQSILQLGDVLNINSGAYIMIYIQNRRGSGLHLLPIEKIVPLHYLSSQAVAGTLRKNLPVHRDPVLRDLSQQILEVYVPAPDYGGLTIPPEHLATYEQLECQYESVKTSLKAALCRSDQLFSLEKSLWVSLPPTVDVDRTAICPSSYFELAVVPTQLPESTPWRLRIIETELALTDGVLTGNPCHTSAAHSIIEAKISAAGLHRILTRCAWLASNWISSFDASEVFIQMEELL